MRQTFKFSVLVALTAVSLTSESLFASAPLADKDATREWHGTEYADYLFSKFREQNPAIPFVIDATEMKIISSEDGRSKPPEREGNIQKQTLERAKNVFGNNASMLIDSLESGRRLNLTDQFSPSLERQLSQWLRAQTPGSIAPDDMMVEALRLTNGHVIAAWAVAWNVSREHWMNAQTRNYSDFIGRFVSVTGERDQSRGAARYVIRDEPTQRAAIVTTTTKEGRKISVSKQIPLMQLAITKRGDDFSTIYHHIGVELLALVMSQRANSSAAGKFTAWIGAIGEYANFHQTAGLSGENRKRLINDLQAGKSGGRLFDLFKGRSQPRAGILAQGPAYYLQSHSLTFGSAYQLDDSTGRPSAYFRKNVDPKFWAPAMSEEELLLRFRHAVNYDSGIINDIVVSAGNGDSERLHLGLQAYIDSGVPNQELNELIRNFDPSLFVIPNPRDVLVDLDTTVWTSELLLGNDVGDFTFEEATVRQTRMIDKTKAAIRLKAEAAVAARDRESKRVFEEGLRSGASSSRVNSCSAAFTN